MAEPRSMHQPFPSWFVAPSLQCLLCKLDYKWKVAALDIFPKQHLGIWMEKANCFIVKAYISVFRRACFYFWLPTRIVWANTIFKQHSHSNNLHNWEQSQEFSNSFRWWTRHWCPETPTAVAGHCTGPASCRPLNIRQKTHWPPGKKTLTEKQFCEKERGSVGIYLPIFCSI